jgi:hypothetical protein
MQSFRDVKLDGTSSPLFTLLLFLALSCRSTRFSLMNVDALHRAFSHWLSKTRRSVAQRAEELAREERLRRETLRDAWTKWRDAYKEARLWPMVSFRLSSRLSFSFTLITPFPDLPLTTRSCSFHVLLVHLQEDQVSQLRDRTLLDVTLLYWETRSTVALAIHFHKTHLKRRALQRLQEEYPLRKARNRADAVYRERTLCESS